MKYRKHDKVVIWVALYTTSTGTILKEYGSSLVANHFSYAVSVKDFEYSVVESSIEKLISRKMN